MKSKYMLTGSNRYLDGIAILILRLTIGYILFHAGAGKALGWFEGFGPEKTLGFYAKTGFNPFWTYMSIYAEFIGGFLLGVGLLTRLAAIPVAINMFVAFYVTLPKGFFQGMASFPFTLLIIAVAILLMGPGLFSIDALIERKAGISGT
jgi:putative oxidoreductase